MKRSIIVLGLIVMLVSACSVPHSQINVEVQAPTTAQQITADAAEPAAEATATQAAVQTPTPAFTQTPEPTFTPESMKVSFENVSLLFPIALGGGLDGQMVPAVEELGVNEAHPAFVQFTFRGYPFPSPATAVIPEIRIYPAVEYAAVGRWGAESLRRLQAVLADPAMPLLNESLPNVSFYGAAAQLYAAQARRISFQSGSGVRMISSYAQYRAAIDRQGSVYHFEGLTKDGKYFVVVTAPVELPVYSTAANRGEFGITYPENMGDTAALDAYFQAMTKLLDSYEAGAFNPILDLLDSLVQSIQVESK